MGRKYASKHGTETCHARQRKPDNPSVLAFVRFWTKADIG
jgi:hypothetical protein